MKTEDAAGMIGQAVGRAAMELAQQLGWGDGIVQEAEHGWENIKLEVEGGTLTIGKMTLTVRRSEEPDDDADGDLPVIETSPAGEPL